MSCRWTTSLRWLTTSWVFFRNSTLSFFLNRFHRGDFIVEIMELTSSGLEFEDCAARSRLSYLCLTIPIVNLQYLRHFNNYCFVFPFWLIQQYSRYFGDEIRSSMHEVPFLLACHACHASRRAELVVLSTQIKILGIWGLEPNKHRLSCRWQRERCDPAMPGDVGAHTSKRSKELGCRQKHDNPAWL